ncbi:hypothetical protein [Lactiplantibacillus fabifermentans]|uniref:Extracellular protein n=1 Tax=Lactiplantibacillus fabifermentans DSM 21115 TaxID=1413187 RepID=A0A0R2NYW2_9LACO|nr:hypothetical protein [Lactiplantibacillus fabifermentans]KRO28781.1 hypothetical protein DY78_GL001961 [Lactiplantibacillus fabifermentans DSM 21115]
MKKFNTVLATLALALPMAVTPLAPAATLLANAATTKKAATLTGTVSKAKTLKKTDVHVDKKTATENISFRADSNAATVSARATKLVPKTTYKAIHSVAFTSHHKTTTYYELTNTKGDFIGWAPASKLAKGADTAKKATAKKATVTKATAKKAATKKATAKKATAKKATAKKATAKKTTKRTTKKAVKKLTTKKGTKKTANKPTKFLAAGKATTIKKAYTAKKAGTVYHLSFSADQGSATAVKTGTLKTGRHYTAIRAWNAKTSAKASAHNYVYLEGNGWTATGNLKATK